MVMVPDPFFVTHSLKSATSTIVFHNLNRLTEAFCSFNVRRTEKGLHEYTLKHSRGGKEGGLEWVTGRHAREAA